MKLFDLNSKQKKEAKRLFFWHLAYLGLIAIFFIIIYFFNYYKSSNLLRERFIFIYMAPLATLVFILISPWRKAWKRALTDTYARLEGEPVFCVMATFVWYFGFYIYSVLLWGLGALAPSIFYM